MNRPITISLAGLDPSGGAGLLADVKTFEQHKVYGFGICTAITAQTDSEFISNEWIKPEKIIAQLKPLLQKFEVNNCKIGLVENMEVLQELVAYLKESNPSINIVIDPILSASAGFNFHHWDDMLEQFIPILKNIALLTPNYTELISLGNADNTNSTAMQWAKYCPILLKGGHNPQNTGVDFLYQGCQTHQIISTNPVNFGKHGSGCVLSAAITANLALGLNLLEACKKAKNYIELFLNSNNSLLGYHHL
jgi:hydroxymethylpyrimidine/phosphomethylpyrimidine kinase